VTFIQTVAIIDGISGPGSGLDPVFSSDPKTEQTEQYKTQSKIF